MYTSFTHIKILTAQALHLDMCIQESNFDGFMSALPRVLEHFISLGNSNYANATEVLLLQFESWKSRDHVAIKILRDHFKAFSEENGEISIGRLMQHLRDSNYAGENIAGRYMESGSSHSIFDFIDVQASHKGTTLKSYSLDFDKWVPRFSLINEKLNEIELKIDQSTFVPFILSKKGSVVRYTKRTARKPCKKHWKKVHKKIKSRNADTVAHLQKHFDNQSSVSTLLVPTSLHEIAISNIFWD